MLQPKLLQKAVNYCRKKVSKLNNNRNLSDLESSSWDSDYSASSETADEKSLQLKETRQKNKNKGEKVKKIENQEETSKTKYSKPKENKKDGNIEKRKASKVKLVNTESLNKKSQMTIRLFRKIQTPSSDTMLSEKASEIAKWVTIDTKNVKQTPQPDFLFKKNEKGKKLNVNLKTNIYIYLYKFSYRNLNDSHS